MGIIVKKSALASERDTFRLLVYCSAPPKIRNNAVSVNRLLAEKLLQFEPMQRTMRIGRCFDEVIDSLQNGTVIKDIDVLFNPEYKIDILKLLAESCKRKRFALVWPGTLDGNALVYSEEGFPDYHSYDIDFYDIVCVV